MSEVIVPEDNIIIVPEILKDLEITLAVSGARYSTGGSLSIGLEYKGTLITEIDIDSYDIKEVLGL
jgi:hypothetical protein